jgi:hypothetical protein
MARFLLPRQRIPINFPPIQRILLIQESFSLLSRSFLNQVYSRYRRLGDVTLSRSSTQPRRLILPAAGLSPSHSIKVLRMITFLHTLVYHSTLMKQKALGPASEWWGLQRALFSWFSGGVSYMLQRPHSLHSIVLWVDFYAIYVDKEMKGRSSSLRIH